MAKQKEAWDKLSMQEKAQLIKLSVDNGVSSLKQIRDTYNLYNSGDNLVHKKSGEEQEESSYIQKQDNTNVSNLPIIEPIPVPEDMQLTEQQLAELNHAKALYENEGLNTMWNAGVVDWMPILGDFKQVTDAAGAATQGDYLTAGILGGLMFVPNIIEKPLKKLKLTKALKDNPLQQSVPDDEIQAWLAENWYKNEIHNVRPKLEERSVDLMDFDRHGIPEHYTLDRDLPTHNRNKDNILIHVDNRTPLLVGRQGFLPIDANMGDAPAIWWQRDWPYYPAPTSLIPTSKFGNTPVTGHTLRVREGDVVPLDPHVRYPNAQGDIVVTEGVLPYDVLEGYKWNADQTWFEKERFAPSKSRWDYFKGDGLPGWSTFSTGGLLYPFSFEKNPFLKTPIVRY